MGKTSYYLYQKYIKIGNQDWIPDYPNVWSVDGDGTMPVQIKSNDDPNCGYIPPSEPIYRWVDMDSSTNWICDDCPESKDYFKITALEDTQFIFSPNYSYSPNGLEDIYFYYSLDDGLTWTRSIEYVFFVTPVLHAGESVLCKASGLTVTQENGIGSFSNNYQHFDISGNILSLVYGDDFENHTTISNNYQFKGLFSGTSVVNASGLTLPTNVTEYCYEGMFYQCGALVSPPPVLQATTLAEGCYKQMFEFCDDMTIAPVICATTMATSACTSMFRGCTSMTQAPILSGATLAPYCYANMFSDCYSLQAAPYLPAMDLYEACYINMFSRCSGITNIYLPATDLVGACYAGICHGCSSLNEIVCRATTNLEYLQYAEPFKNVASRGTFYMVRNVQYPSGVIPSRWTIRYL